MKRSLFILSILVLSSLVFAGHSERGRRIAFCCCPYQLPNDCTCGLQNDPCDFNTWDDYIASLRQSPAFHSESGGEITFKASIVGKDQNGDPIYEEDPNGTKFTTFKVTSLKAAFDDC